MNVVCCLRSGWGTTSLDQDMVYDEDFQPLQARHRALSSLVKREEKEGIMLWHQFIIPRYTSGKKKQKKKKQMRRRVFFFWRSL